MKMTPMSFAYHRTVRFADTDAAGVVYFANYLSICHEAYEDALAQAGIELNAFFRDTGVVVPVAKSSADYLRPLACGDKLRITLAPAPLSENSFAIDYELWRLGRPDKIAARVRTEHVCTSPKLRERAPLPPALAAWVRSPAA